METILQRLSYYFESNKALLADSSELEGKARPICISISYADFNNSNTFFVIGAHISDVGEWWWGGGVLLMGLDLLVSDKA